MPIRVVAFDTQPNSLSQDSTSPSRAKRLPESLPIAASSALVISSSVCIVSSTHASMATPSSSATSPSPPMAYLSHNQLPLQLPISSSSDVVEREHRKKAVEKFLARAEISMVTRALRARLSYASYKATHNIPHVNIRDLEAQSQQSQAASFNRTIAAKRKAGASNYYNNPATQGTSGNVTGTGTQRRGGSGSMAPPASISSPRTHYPSANNTGAANANETATSSRNVHHPPSLYASILAPPPTKQARTIHNANDPPVPAPSRPTPSPRARVPKQSPRTDTRPHGKGRQVDKAKAASSPDRRKAKRASIDKGKQKQLQSNMDVDGDIDMKAAATLTSLLLHHRPSIAGSASSPRSSLDGSDAGSTYSYSHFAQSSTRTTTTSTFSPPVSTITSNSMDVDSRNQTPPPPISVNTTSTPRLAPTDNEAADLMLFLATSPSPARVPNKDPKDLRALGGAPGPLRSKGRVLFPSIGSGELPGHDDPSGAIASRVPSTLVRGGDSSFSSSISSIGTEMGARNVDSSQSHSSIARTPSQLLSPPPLPAPSTVPQGEGNQSPRPLFPSGSMDFNFHDFINASPSPSRGTTTQNYKSNLGLRADVGRKLFEEEQMRHALNSSQSPDKQQNERSLGAGIDLVPT